jgi:hypothetical protein
MFMEATLRILREDSAERDETSTTETRGSGPIVEDWIDGFNRQKRTFKRAV